MSAIKGVLDDLVRRRLWPIALLLIVAAVAAPIVLASEPEVAAPPPPTGASATVESQPIASLVEDFSADARRRVLGDRKDPFRPSGRQPKPAKTASAPSSVGSATGATSGATGGATGATSATGGATGGGNPPAVTGGGPVVPDTGAPGGAPTTPAPTSTPDAPTSTPDADPTPKFDLHSLRIRFDGTSRRLKRLEPLPDAENPSIIYLGLLRDEKTAVFLLDESVTTEGDGACRPSPDNCQRVHLTKGETQFFDVAPEEGADGESVEHQLEVLDITVARTKSAATARKAYARSSAAGRRALRSRAARAGRLRYDARTGLLRTASAREQRATVARAALRAAFGAR
jgi:hypothetical protein